MSMNELQITFWFGIILVFIGIFLLPFKFSGSGLSKIKLPAIEMEINGPALFVMFLGAGLIWFSASKRELESTSAIAPAPAPSRPTPSPTPAPAPAPVAETTPAPEPSPTPSPSLDQTPLEPSGSNQFGVVLIALSTPQAAIEQAKKSKSMAPADAAINIYRRNSVWAVAVLYSDNSKAGADVAAYKSVKDWSSAYVVKLDAWCPKAKPISVSLPPPIRSITAIECKMR
jgi:hypothetical protein